MTSEDISPEWQKLGLFDPNAPDAGERRDLLKFYEEVGQEAHEYEGVTPDQLAYAANQRFNRPGERWTREEAQQRSELSPDLFEKVLLAMGYPTDDDRFFTDADIATFRVFEQAKTLFSESEMLHFTAVMSSTMARMADAATALFRIDVTSKLEESEGTLLDYAKKNYEASVLVQGMLEPLWAIFLLQLELSSVRSDQGRSATDAKAHASTVRMGVGFVDLVGFTPLAVEMSVDELGKFIINFEQSATAIVASHRGRVVKLIGDEVMFVAVDVDHTVAIAVDLMKAFGAAGVQPHGGVSYGDLIARGGDYYGRVVNLAARAASLALPGELLVDESTSSAVSNYEFEPAGRRQLKGFPEPVRMSSLTIDWG